MGLLGNSRTANWDRQAMENHRQIKKFLVSFRRKWGRVILDASSLEKNKSSWFWQLPVGYNWWLLLRKGKKGSVDLPAFS